MRLHFTHTAAPSGGFSKTIPFFFFALPPPLSDVFILFYFIFLLFCMVRNYYLFFILRFMKKTIAMIGIQRVNLLSLHIVSTSIQYICAIHQPGSYFGINFRKSDILSHVPNFHPNCVDLCLHGTTSGVIVLKCQVTALLL